MYFLYSVFFGAGVAGFAYSNLARRVGYGNHTNVTKLVLTIFVIATLVFYSILALFIK